MVIKVLKILLVSILSMAVPTPPFIRTTGMVFITQEILSPFDEQHLTVYQAVGNLFPCNFIYTLDGGPCYVHLLGTHLLIKSFHIYEAYCLIFIDGHGDGFSLSCPDAKGAKPVVFRKATDISPFSRSWHNCSLYVLAVLCMSCYRHMSITLL